ncbi:hypothetical protein QUF55_09355 [Clostridiaceae bacterium HSG29]|nr:hypothetical protein [Clostridiaceae bacterium HSG29]
MNEVILAVSATFLVYLIYNIVSISIIIISVFIFTRIGKKEKV